MSKELDAAISLALQSTTPHSTSINNALSSLPPVPPSANTPEFSSLTPSKPFLKTALSSSGTAERLKYLNTNTLGVFTPPSPSPFQNAIEAFTCEGSSQIDTTFFRNNGTCTVPLYPFTPSSTPSSTSSSTTPPKPLDPSGRALDPSPTTITCTLNTWLDTYRTSPKQYYLKDFHLTSSIPSSSNLYTPPSFAIHDILNPFLKLYNNSDYKFLYWGPKLSNTEIHSDVCSTFSWSFNVIGRKLWKFYDDRGDKLEFIQEKGEVVFVPCDLKHEVENLEETISINHNWITGASTPSVWSTIKHELLEVTSEINRWNLELEIEEEEEMLRSACGLNVGMFFLMCVLGCVRGEERLVEVLEGEEGDDELLDKGYEVLFLRNIIRTLLTEDIELIKERCPQKYIEIAQTIIASPPTNPRSDSDWARYLQNSLLERSDVPDDFGLRAVASHLGKSDALDVLDSATELECDGNFKDAMREYNAAYRLWPALDSVLAGGLPRGVREEAIKSGYDGPLLTDVDVAAARSSQVAVKRGLLSGEDIELLLRLAGEITESDGGKNFNNPENKTHVNKYAIMVNDPPSYRLRTELPMVLGKVVRFAQQSITRDSKWCEEDGPLKDFEGGCSSLTVRVAEVWTYAEGGGLVDNWHYDTDSIVTIVCLLSDRGDFSGGSFQTYENGDRNIEHGMEKGDGVCFVSHKYHNIAKVEGGQRRSLVVELWEGEGGKKGR